MCGPQIDAIEHEGAQREHRRTDLLTLADVTLALGGLDEIVDECVDALRPFRSEKLDLFVRQVRGIEDPMTDGVVDVVVDVGHAVDDADDPALEGLGLLRPGVLENSVPHFRGQVERLGDPQRLLVVAETGLEALPQRLVERFLAGVAERRVPHVVAEADRLRQVLVQAQGARDSASDGCRLERVRHPRPEVVAVGIDEDLRLPFQAAEGLRMENPVAVALERRAQTTLFVLARAPACAIRADGERRQPRLLVLAYARLEGIRHSACQFRHGLRHVR